MSHGCTQRGSTCASCLACARLRFVEVVTFSTGEQLHVQRCTHCDYPAGAR